MNVDAIPLGANFAKVLGEEVAKCDVLLAIIGPGWIDARDEDGRRRLDNPHDFGRIEIAAALKRDIPVIPVLLQGTRAPKADQLPDDLKELALRNGLDVRHASFHADMDKLIRGLGGQRATPPGAIVVDLSPNGKSNTRAVVPGNGRTEWFTDHPQGPEMVVVPAGSFMMGSLNTEPQRESWLRGSESPHHKVTIAQPFAVGRHAITRAQFAAFVNNTGYNTDGGAQVWKRDKWEHDLKGSWRNPGFAQDDSHPVICVNWNDANAHADWLSGQTGKAYRLLNEAEREYVARAGSTTPFWWGSSITPAQANYDGNQYAGGGSKGEWRKATVSVGSFAANPWGLFNVHGNIFEWCQDVWHDDYNGSAADSSAWQQGGDAGRRVVRGGAWKRFFFAGARRSARAHCPLIGNKDYRPGVGVLTNPLNDARIVAPRDPGRV
jgi:formylglycine-generating enzyme required for sulfatase activity